MCGRYVLGESDLDVIEQRFIARVKGRHEFASRYNVAPSQTMPVVLPGELHFMQWGFAPPWAQKEVINARFESLSDKPYFRDAHHCLVPATGFYEWKQEKEAKVPYYFHLQNNKLFAFAGLCNERGYAIVTTEARGAVALVHTRMPVILQQEQETMWLTGTLHATKEVPLLAQRASSAVSNPKNDNPSLILE